MDNLNLSIPSVQETALSPEEQIEWLYKYKESKLTAGSNIRITREGDTTVISAIGEGFSPLVTITPIEGGNRLTIVDGEGSHSCDIMDGVDGVDGVSPQIVISSITGGHSVKVIDATHPTGQTFNVLDGTDGEDGSSVIVKSIDAVEGGVNVTLEDENGDHVLFLANGPQGLTGPAATVAVGTTTTTEPGGNAEVTNVGTASNAVFNFKIPTGQTGADGQDGADGVSPEVSFASITGGNRMTVTDAEHPLGQSIDIMDGEDGSDGTDGVSPEVIIGVISGGHSVTITDADHPQGQTFDVMDGENAAAATVTVGTTTTGEAGTNASVVNVGTSSDAVLNFTIPRGADGTDGSDGQDGSDGVSPEVSFASITGGNRMTVTDAEHPLGQSIDIMDGQDGAQGETGPAGPGVPQGGTAGQYLKKASSTDYDTEWGDVEALPSGGNNGDVLTKATTGPMWAAPVQELPTGGSTGQVLTKTATGVAWQTPASGGASKLVHVAEISRYSVNVFYNDNTTASGGSSTVYSDLFSAVKCETQSGGTVYRFLEATPYAASGVNRDYNVPIAEFEANDAGSNINHFRLTYARQGTYAMYTGAAEFGDGGTVGTSNTEGSRTLGYVDIGGTKYVCIKNTRATTKIGSNTMSNAVVVVEYMLPQAVTFASGAALKFY